MHICHCARAITMDNHWIFLSRLFVLVFDVSLARCTHDIEMYAQVLWHFHTLNRLEMNGNQRKTIRDKLNRSQLNSEQSKHEALHASGNMKKNDDNEFKQQSLVCTLCCFLIVSFAYLEFIAISDKRMQLQLHLKAYGAMSNVFAFNSLAMHHTRHSGVVDSCYSNTDCCQSMWYTLCHYNNSNATQKMGWKFLLQDR